MKKNFIIYLTVIGLIGLFSACEKDETRTVMSASPTAPIIQTIPDLTLTRATGANMLTFIGTPVDPGFQASVIYYLEACPSGNKFANVTSILSSAQDAALKITVADLNGILLKAFPADAVSTVDFRIRSVLVADAGTGVAPLVYNSPTKAAQVTLYGLPRLNLVNSGVDQKVESALGNGVYTGYVKINVANPFTLQDPDFNKSYGGAEGVLAENGPALTVDPLIGSGWYKLTANTNDMKYTYTPYMIGLIGSATPNGWNTPDQKMDYDAETGTWKITITLVDGMIKFRLNDAWAWNLGGTYDNLTVDGPDMPVTAGNYTIVLTITNPNSVKGEVGGFCTVTKN